MTAVRHFEFSVDRLAVWLAFSYRFICKLDKMLSISCLN